MMFKSPNLLLLLDVILVLEYCTYYQRSVLFFYPDIILTKPEPYPHIYVHVKPRSHDSANDNTVKFIRENKSPEGKSVEILVFGVYKKKALRLREVHMTN